MKTASQAANKWASNAAGAASDYAQGAQSTTKDQASAAIAAKGLYAQGVQEAIAQDRYAKGLSKSGKSGWLKGVTEKGSQNYSVGVTSPSAQSSYAANSGRYDSARGAAASLPRASKGSPANLARVTAVVNALRAVKVGK